MNDIGAAAGMAGPSIYHYFVSKGEILEAIFRRGINWIEFDQMRAARDEADALEVLERTLSYYAAMGLDHHELFSIYVVDSVHLDHRGHASVIKSYARMIDHWVALMARARPELPAGEARLLVTAALCEVNELTEVPRLTHAEGGRSRLLQATRVIISA